MSATGCYTEDETLLSCSRTVTFIRYSEKRTPLPQIFVTRKLLWETARAIQDGGHKRCQPASFGDRYLRYTARTRICISFQDSFGDPHRNASKL